MIEPVCIENPVNNGVFLFRKKFKNHGGTETTKSHGESSIHAKQFNFNLNYLMLF